MTYTCLQGVTASFDVFFGNSISLIKSNTYTCSQLELLLNFVFLLRIINSIIGFFLLLDIDIGVFYKIMSSLSFVLR